MQIDRIYGRHLTVKNIRMSNFADAQLTSYSVPSCSFDETPPEPSVLGDPSGPHIELGPTFDVEGCQTPGCQTPAVWRREF